jgi:hypothetical protein
MLWPSLIFWGGFVLLTYLIAKKNEFGIKDAVLTATGKREYERTMSVNIGIASILFVPLFLWVYLIAGCNP